MFPLRSGRWISGLAVQASLCVLWVLVLSGCTQIYDVKIDALNNPELEAGFSYRIVPKDPLLAEKDPNYAKAEGMVRNALSGQGMFEAENPEEAAVVVEIDYGVGPLRVKVEAAPDDPLHAERALDLRPAIRPGRESTTYLEEQIRRQQGVVDDRRHPNSGLIVREVYEKRLTIVAREGRAAEAADADADEDGAAREIWRVEAKIEDEKDKVDRVLPILAGAAADQIGKDVRGRKRLAETDQPVVFVKGGA